MNGITVILKYDNPYFKIVPSDHEASDRTKACPAIGGFEKLECNENFSNNYIGFDLRSMPPMIFKLAPMSTRKIIGRQAHPYDLQLIAFGHATCKTHRRHMQN
jgi:hypothetical protein